MCLKHCAYGHHRSYACDTTPTIHHCTIHVTLLPETCCNLSHRSSRLQTEVADYTVTSGNHGCLRPCVYHCVLPCDNSITHRVYHRVYIYVSTHTSCVSYVSCVYTHRVKTPWLAPLRMESGYTRSHLTGTVWIHKSRLTGTDSQDSLYRCRSTRFTLPVQIHNVHFNGTYSDTCAHTLVEYMQTHIYQRQIAIAEASASRGIA